MPTITGFDPAGSASYDGGESVTLSGTGFHAVTSVGFGGYPANFQIVDDSTIVATAPAFAGTVYGASHVSVLNGSLGSDSAAEWTWGGYTGTQLQAAHEAGSS